MAETAVATESDLDADNYADALEADLGLDPTSPDTDADGVADGDEITLYGTEPTLADTDGDGVFDGEELFGIITDPLVWNDFSTDASTQSMAQEAASAPAESIAATERGRVARPGDDREPLRDQWRRGGPRHRRCLGGAGKRDPRWGNGPRRIVARSGRQVQRHRELATDCLRLRQHVHAARDRTSAGE